MEEFKDFLKNIPESAAVPMEEMEGDTIHESESLVNELEVLKSHEGAKEAQIALLPQIKKLIVDLRKLQEAGDSEQIRNSIVRLVAERDRIEKMVN